MSLPPFRHVHRVTYAECTLGNHIYYARYLDLLEEARGEFFRALGMSSLALQNEGVLLPVIDCHVSYHAPARYDELIAIEVWLTELTRLKIGFGYRISAEGKPRIIEGTTLHVATGVDEKPKRLRPEMVELLRGYLKENVVAV